MFSVLIISLYALYYCKEQFPTECFDCFYVFELWNVSKNNLAKKNSANCTGDPQNLLNVGALTKEIVLTEFIWIKKLFWEEITAIKTIQNVKQITAVKNSLQHYRSFQTKFSFQCVSSNPLDQRASKSTAARVLLQRGLQRRRLLVGDRAIVWILLERASCHRLRNPTSALLQVVSLVQRGIPVGRELPELLLRRRGAVCGH